MAPLDPPTSPTSLLWAHQLKREHGYLLERMQKLEAEIARVDSRNKAIETNASKDDLAALAEQVRTLKDGGKNEAENLRQDVMTRLAAVSTDMEDIVKKITTIGDKGQQNKEDWERASGTQKSLLKRIEDVERNLQEYAHALELLGKEMDAAQTAKAWKMLDEMKEQVKAGQSGLDSVAANLITLEEVSDELKAQNAKLAKQIKELAKRPAKESTPGTAAVDVPQPDTPVEQTSTPHEGGTKKVPANAPDARDKHSEMVKTKGPAPRGVKKSRAPAAQKLKPEATVAALSRNARLGPVQQRGSDKDLESPVVRSGRGWIEVEEPIERSDGEERGEERQDGVRGAPRQTFSSEPSKHGRGQPRGAAIRSSIESPEPSPNPETKQQRPQQAQKATKPRKNRLLSNLMDMEEAAAPRQTRSQAPAKALPMPKTNTNRPLPKPRVYAEIPKTNPTASKITKKSAPKKSQRKDATQRMSSPIESPPALTQPMRQTQRKGIVDSSDVESQELPPPPPRKRRTIEQPDGDEIFVTHRR
ncbi:hypothetical protein TI39_contig339g00043 [Zymoseptoria brevis]|uniref:Uncharacterized protein n=1 Tax=Zymoseptoria brevis TaxID=1047168 RepID=A0A0F4GVG5_9PEZI|nr:hypothetical protein TI39_contig339g00043 [Zymoseptoria brevis]